MRISCTGKIPVGLVRKTRFGTHTAQKTFVIPKPISTKQYAGTTF